MLAFTAAVLAALSFPYFVLADRFVRARGGGEDGANGTKSQRRNGETENNED